MNRFSIALAGLSLLTLSTPDATNASDRQRHGNSGHTAVHRQLQHNNYHRAQTHRSAHQYGISRGLHSQLHQSLNHDRYHGRVGHQVYHQSTRSYRGYGGYGGYGYGTSRYSGYSRGGVSFRSPGFSIYYSR